MRNEESVKKVLLRLGCDGDSFDSDAIPLLDWAEDSFRYGFLAGKLVALGWVLGEPSGDLLADHHSFDEWVRELNEVNDHLTGKACSTSGAADRADAGS